MKTDIAKQACDIFSIGVVLWKMVNGIHSKPFDRAINTDINYCLIYNKLFDTFWQEKHSGCRLVKLKTRINDNYESKNSIHLMNLIEKMFIFDPHSRITINEIMDHEWYKNTKSYNNDKYKNIFYNKMSQIHIKVKQKFSHLRSQKKQKLHHQQLLQQNQNQNL